MSSKEEIVRTTELKTKIYGNIAKKLLKNSKAIQEIELDEIETHKGRQSKALRLIHDILGSRDTRSKKSQNYGGTRTEHYFPVKKFDTDSAQYGKAPTFISTWQEVHDQIFNDVLRPKVSSVGYIPVDYLSNENAIYVYWNPDEYDISKGKHGVEIYPRALQETRTKAMLRAIIEEHFQDDFTSKLERYLGIPADSLRREDDFTVKVRNFSARAACFTEERFYGETGYLAEYEHYRKYYEALITALHKLSDLIKARGGFAKVIEEMRRDTMAQLVENAPLNIAYEGDDKEPESSSDPLIHKWRNKEVSGYILAHANYFDYDTLYATDTSVIFFDNGDAMPRSTRQFDGFGNFIPTSHNAHWNRREDNVINTFLKELSACSTNQQSNDSQTTC